MKLLTPDISELLPTVPSIIYSQKTYDIVQGLIVSYRTGEEVPHIELVKHPSKPGYLISEGHKRTFAAYIAGVKPRALLIEDDADYDQLEKAPEILPGERDDTLDDYIHRIPGLLSDLAEG